jgi:hypothetical protein
MAQTPPTYPELFQDPPRFDQLTQADVSNLGRLVVLEATSMFVHVRSDLAYSPELYSLLNDVVTVWHAADAFVAAVSYFPTEAQRIDAGRLAFPNLEAAFNQLRGSFLRFPGWSDRATLNLVYLSQSMAVIGPLLSENPPALAQVATPTSSGPSLTEVRELAREILPLIQSLRAGLATPETADRRELPGDLEVLESLAIGLDWIAFGRVADTELVAAIRPLRKLAQRIDLRMQREGPAQLMFSQWIAIRQRIDGLAAQFQLPREIIPLAALAKSSREPGVIGAIHESVNEIETLLEGPGRAAAGAGAGEDAVPADLRRLRTRLFLLRQHLLGESPGIQVDRALREVESAGRQLEADAGAGRIESRDKLDALVRKVRETAARIRDGRATLP